MRRALGEYLVTGIRTTVPFFTWLLAQPEFVEGRFHTAYLDEVLKARHGRPFVESTPEQEDIAVIAAALEAVLSPSALEARSTVTDGDADVARPWRTQARLEGLRS
jgi:acetyl/propionyl-CoA carboxylase alpha subunit